MDLTGSDYKVERVKELFEIAHVDIHAEELKMVYQQLAISHLEAISVDAEKKKILKDFSTKLLNRSL